MKRFLLGAVCIALSLCGSAAAAAAIKEGKWSMTTTVRMEGMQGEAAQAMKEMENMPPEQRAMMERMNM